MTVSIMVEHLLRWGVAIEITIWSVGHYVINLTEQMSRVYKTKSYYN